jgi:DNA-binding NarL/FixJ family response regulator
LFAIPRPSRARNPPISTLSFSDLRRLDVPLEDAARISDELADLTPQERKTLTLVAEGKTNKEIAAEVFLSDKTVKNYVNSILSKLNLERRA